MPPLLLSASIFTAPNVDRQRPSARPASICCGGGGLFCAAVVFSAPGFELEVAEPAAARQAPNTAITRARLPTLIGHEYSAASVRRSERTAAGCCRFLAT